MNSQTGLTPIRKARNGDGAWPGYDKYEVQERFLEALRLGGNIAVAIEYAQVWVEDSRRIRVRRPVKQTFYNWRESDEDFKELWDQAVELALGKLQVNLQRLATESRRDEVQFQAARFLLSRLDRARFGPKDDTQPTTIVVRMAVPEPLNPKDLPDADPDELADFAQLGAATNVPQYIERNDDGVPE